MRKNTRTDSISKIYTFLVLLLVAISAYTYDIKSHTIISDTQLEITYKASSPTGMSGGTSLPASCDSGWNGAADNHGGICCVAANGTACTSAANSCGSTSSGTTNCDGTCSASTPANPSNYGSSCTATNACGSSSSGTIGCDNVTCSATAPALPSNYGKACTSAANSCGSTASGTIGCDNVTCSASTPANPANYGTACTSAANSCGSTSSGTIKCDGTCSATAPANPANYGTACTSAANSCGSTSSGTIKCDGTCSAGTPALPSNYGKSCTSAANVCGMTNSGSIGCDNVTCSATKPADSLCNPDLTAGAVSPTSAIATIAGTFNATVTNNGGLSTGSSFFNFFQVATGSNGSGTISDLSAISTATLGSGSSRSLSQSYTFPSSGTYSMRLCADKSNSSSSGTIAETNESNNCGAWTNIAVSTPANCTGTSHAWSTNCSGSSATITSGSSFTVTNDAQYYTGQATYSCTNGTWSGPTNPSCATICTNNWKQSCVSSNKCGMTGGTGTYECNGTCNAAAPSDGLCPPTIISFKSSPKIVAVGRVATLSWTIDNAKNCQITNDAGLSPAPRIITDQTGNSTATQTYTIVKRTTFTLTCDGTSMQQVVSVSGMAEI